MKRILGYLYTVVHEIDKEQIREHKRPMNQNSILDARMYKHLRNDIQELIDCYTEEMKHKR